MDETPAVPYRPYPPDKVATAQHLADMHGEQATPVNAQARHSVLHAEIDREGGPDSLVGWSSTAIPHRHHRLALWAVPVYLLVKADHAPAAEAAAHSMIQAGTPIRCGSDTVRLMAGRQAEKDRDLSHDDD